MKKSNKLLFTILTAFLVLLVTGCVPKDKELDENGKDRVQIKATDKVINKNIAAQLEASNSPFAKPSEQEQNVNILFLYKHGCPYCNTMKQKLYTELGKQKYSKERGYVQITPVDVESTIGRQIQKDNKVHSVPFLVIYQPGNKKTMTVLGETTNMVKKAAKYANDLVENYKSEY